MITLPVYFCIFLVLLCMVSSVWGADKTFNVINFGAVGDGKTDDLPVHINLFLEFSGTFFSHIYMKICKHLIMYAGFPQGMGSCVPIRIQSCNTCYTKKKEILTNTFIN